jgi:hypothetical protein
MHARSRQRGTAVLALLLVMCTVAAMVGALAVRAATTDLHVSGVNRLGRTGFYCAEAGLYAARPFFATNYALWNNMFDPAQPQPAGYPVTGDLDGDGRVDYSVTLIDNTDEFPPTPNNPLRDGDLTAIMVSRCVSPTMGPRELHEIVRYNGRGTNYRMQSGHGSNHAGTEN